MRRWGFLFQDAVDLGGESHSKMPPTSKAQPASFFVLRTPLLPVGTFFDWGRDLNAPGATEDALGEALARDRRVLGDRLRAYVARADVREALLLASDTLSEAAEAWTAREADDRAKGAIEPLVRYVARMAMRATPFGLLSGTSLGRIGETSKISLRPETAYRRSVQVDVQFLCALGEALEQNPAIRRELTYFPSNALDRKADQVSYLEARMQPGTNERSHHLVSVEMTPHLKHALEQAAQGITLDELATSLVRFDAEVTHEEAQDFAAGLVAAQVLQSELVPSVTGTTALDAFVETLAKTRAGRADAEHLRAVRDALAAVEKLPPGEGGEACAAIAASLAERLPGTPLARILHVELFKPVQEASLGPAVLQEVERSSALAVRICRVVAPDVLGLFRETFRERYEDREVPLLEALDPDTGIGATLGPDETADPAPLLDGLPFPSDDAAASVPFGRRERWILKRLDAAARTGAREWSLSDEDVEELERTDERRTTLPSAFSAVITLAADSADALDEDFQVLLHGTSGPAGANMFGRSCHGDAELAARAREHLRAEERLHPDAVFAEIVHLPEGREGNIVTRPVLRDYEIAFGGRSGAPHDKQIAAADLLVSVRGDRIYLRSRRLGREVVPRMATAHNYQKSASPLYRFLATLQRQWGRSGVAWHWGAFETAPFLPRVRRGRTVFSLAQWRLDERDTEGLVHKRDAALFAAVRAIQKARGLPRYVTLLDGENMLTIDFDNALSVDAFAQLAVRERVVTLRELFPSPGTHVVRGASPGESFANEIVIPFVRSPEPQPPIPAPRRTTIPRRMTPGSEWMYLKLYGGTASADAVLSTLVAPVAANALASGAATSWFFLRYFDPHPHLRLRLRGDRSALYGRVLADVHARAESLLSRGALWKIQLDTYERELERYGGDGGMELAESIFAVDSDATCRIVSSLYGDGAAAARSLLAIRGADDLLVALGLRPSERLELTRRLRADFAREHRVGRQFDWKLGEQHRRRRREIEDVLAWRGDAEHPLGPALAVLSERSRALAPIVGELARRARDGELDTPWTSLSASFVHMHLNRMLLSNHRRQELVIYDALARTQTSELARAERAEKGAA